MRKLLFVLLAFLFLTGSIFAQTYLFDSVFFRTHGYGAYGGGPHGAVVAPDGNIWICQYGNTDTTVWAPGDTTIFHNLDVVDPTGQHVAFSPIKYITVGTDEDTLDAGARGISLDHNGNILFTLYGTLYRINYQTGEGMNKVTPSGSSCTEAAVDASGNIFIGNVGGGNPIYMYDQNFNFVATAVDCVITLHRSIVVTTNGQDLYSGTIWSGRGIWHYHSDIPGVLPHVLEDTISHYNSSGVPDTWASCLDWGPDGYLWGGELDKDKWYAWDVSTGMAVDSLETVGIDTASGKICAPRGLAWSADGNTLYSCDYENPADASAVFGQEGGSVLKWTKNPNGVWELQGKLVPGEFLLSQNYPNPFNPTTTIPFIIHKRTNVNLKIYSIKGELVSELVNSELQPGEYNIPFDASSLSTGTYFYTLTVGNISSTMKMKLVK